MLKVTHMYNSTYMLIYQCPCVIFIEEEIEAYCLESEASLCHIVRNTDTRFI